MANYLLLRNNKESGPYSVDDLMQLGLKAYDLVWVQGKSAAWRYPGEVDELRPFAPMVEEQPFDRFFKKPTEEKKAEAIKQEVHTVAQEQEKYIPKKSVFVTMPGKKPDPVKPATREIKEDAYTSPVPVQQTISVKENPVAAAQIKYSQPLDEIKEMYVKTLQDRKQKIARKGLWVQVLKKAAVILALVAVGVITGFIIKSNGNKSAGLVKDEKAAQRLQLPVEPSSTVPETNTLQQEPPGNTVSPANKNEMETGPSPELKELIKESQAITKDKPAAIKEKKETILSLSKNEVNENAISPGVGTDPATGERIKKVRSDNSSAGSNGNAEKKAFKMNQLSDQVSVTSNEYKKVAFGGIRNLELTVNNNSEYALDHVIVELQYLKPSEEPLKTENIEFRSVGPKATSTIRIPDTNRGIKIAYRIINIRSRQMDEIAAGN